MCPSTITIFLLHKRHTLLKGCWTHARQAPFFSSSAPVDPGVASLALELLQAVGH